jgi:hypothetical protein
VEASRWLALAGLVLGFFGAVFNTVSTSKVIKPGQRLTLTAESATSARRWAASGWVCIVAAFGCGAMSAWVG